MRFEQLKRKSNVILRKKLRKSGKCWIVVIMLSFAAGMAFIGNGSIVKADGTAVDSTNVETSTVTPTDEQKAPEVTNNKSDLQPDSEVKASGTGTPIATGNTKMSQSIDNIPTGSTDSNTGNSSEETPTNDDENMTDPNQTVDDDGNVQANINYSGKTYAVNGKVGEVAAGKADDGSTNYFNINDIGKVSDLTNDSTVTLAGPAGFVYSQYDEYENKLDKGIPGDSSWKVTQEMVNGTSGKTYYHLGSSDAWVLQGLGVALNGEVSGDSKQIITYTNYKLDNSPKEISNFKDDPEPTADEDGNITGDITVHSDNYKRDFKYSYKGQAGETVTASMVDDTVFDYPYAPIVKVAIVTRKTDMLGAGSTITLAGPAGYVYELFNDDLSREPRGLAGDSAWLAVEQRAMSNGDTYYEVAIGEWVKQDTGVALNCNPIANEGKPEPYIQVFSAEPVMADVTISSNKGDQVVPNKGGNIGDIIDVDVPTIKGYTADKKTVKATVNPDRTITTTETVTYSIDKPNKPNNGNHGHHSGGSESNDEEEIGHAYLDQTIATYLHRDAVGLYSLTGNSLNYVKNRALAPGSDWFTDQMITLDNMRYYRVATNEWAKATDVYVYEAVSKILNTDKTTTLVNDEENNVKNRELAADTAWKVDQIDYLGDYQNPTTTYRVATNEFVKK